MLLTTYGPRATSNTFQVAALKRRIEEVLTRAEQCQLKQGLPSGELRRKLLADDRFVRLLGSLDLDTLLQTCIQESNVVQLYPNTGAQP